MNRKFINEYFNDFTGKNQYVSRRKNNYVNEGIIHTVKQILASILELPPPAINKKMYDEILMTAAVEFKSLINKLTLPVDGQGPVLQEIETHFDEISLPEGGFVDNAHFVASRLYKLKINPIYNPFTGLNRKVFNRYKLVKLGSGALGRIYVNGRLSIYFVQSDVDDVIFLAINVALLGKEITKLFNSMDYEGVMKNILKQLPEKV